MEIKTTGRLTESETLQKIRDCLQDVGISMLHQAKHDGGSVYEFESHDMDIRIFCRFPSNHPTHVFIEFELPNIVKKLKSTLSG